MISSTSRLALVLVSTVVLAGLLVASGDTTGATENIFTVTKTEDTNDGACNADCSLREAVIAANANPGQDRIQLGAATYELSRVGKGEDEAATGDLDVNDDVEIAGTSAEETIVDGDGDDTVFALAIDINVTLSDLTVQGGGSASSPNLAGGIYTRANATLERIAVRDNSVGGKFDTLPGDIAGGVWSSGPLLIRDSFIENNSAIVTGTGDETAFAVVIGGVRSGARLTIEQSRIAGNHIEGQNGVAGLRAHTGDVFIRDTVIAENTSGPGECQIFCTLGGGGISLLSVPNADLTRITIAANKVTGGFFGVGGLNVSSTRLRMTDSAIRENKGPGVEIRGSDVSFERTVISDNGGSGNAGGIYASASNLTLSRTDISGNRGGGVGGAFLAGSIVQMDRVNISENEAPGGGGIGGVYQEQSTTRMDEVNISGNTGEVGGLRVAASASSSDDVTMTDSAVTANEGDLGGVLVSLGAVTSLSRSTIANNAGTFYGGILNIGTSTFTNVTVSGNTNSDAVSDDEAAGVYNTGDLRFNYSTIANNTAPDLAVGGIRNDGVTTYVGTIVAGNLPQNCLSESGDAASNGKNVEDADTCGFDQSGDQVDTDPLLSALADNEGFALTHAIGSGSPAVDTGDCAPLSEDGRGYLRPAGMSCDSGAYELGGAVPPDELVWGDNNCSGPPDAGDALLAVVHGAGLSTDTGDCPEMGVVVEVAGASPHPWGDVNCSGLVDAGDALEILAYFAAFEVTPAGSCPAIGSAVQVTPVT